MLPIAGVAIAHNRPGLLKIIACLTRALGSFTVLAASGSNSGSVHSKRGRFNVNRFFQTFWLFTRNVQAMPYHVVMWVVEFMFADLVQL